MLERDCLTGASLFETRGLIQAAVRHTARCCDLIARRELRVYEQIVPAVTEHGCFVDPRPPDGDPGAAAPFSNNLTSPFNRDSTGTRAGQIPDFMKSWIVRMARHAMEAVASDHRRLVKRPPDQLLSGAAEKIGQISAE